MSVSAQANALREELLRCSCKWAIADGARHHELHGADVGSVISGARRPARARNRERASITPRRARRGRRVQMRGWVERPPGLMKRPARSWCACR